MRRPISVTLAAWLFIAAGAAGLVFHAGDLRGPGFTVETAWVALVRLLAIAAGIFLLRGAAWGRGLALAWLAYHVVLSAFHTPFELALHAALLGAVGWALLHPKAAAYFNRRDRSPRSRASAT